MNIKQTQSSDKPSIISTRQLPLLRKLHVTTCADGSGVREQQAEEHRDIGTELLSTHFKTHLSTQQPSWSRTRLRSYFQAARSTDAARRAAVSPEPGTHIRRVELSRIRDAAGHGETAGRTAETRAAFSTSAIVNLGKPQRGVSSAERAALEPASATRGSGRSARIELLRGAETSRTTGGAARREPRLPKQRLRGTRGDPERHRPSAALPAVLTATATRPSWQSSALRHEQRTARLARWHSGTAAP